MQPIPPKLRKQLGLDPFMKKCVSCGSQPVEWNHAIIYAGRQSNTWYSIVPLCTACHRGNNGDIQLKAKVISELVAIKRGMSCGEIYKDMPKVDWYQKKRNLENKLARL